MSSSTKAAATSLVLLSVLASIAALYLLRTILIPIALALLLACLFYPVTTFLRRLLRLSPIVAAVTLFFLAALLGLYLASLTFDSLVQAANTLASDVKDLAGVTSRWVDDVYREHPLLRSVLPNSKTISLLGDMNALLFQGLRSSADNVTYVLVQSFIILILVLFLLAEGEMLAPKAVRFLRTRLGIRSRRSGPSRPSPARSASFCSPGRSSTWVWERAGSRFVADGVRYGLFLVFARRWRITFLTLDKLSAGRSQWCSLWVKLVPWATGSSSPRSSLRWLASRATSSRLM